MPIPVGQRWNYDLLKPENLRDHFTLAELCDMVKRDRSRIKQLEREGRIPAPIRVKHGRHQMRLYSPAEVEAIIEHFKNAKPGRPRTKARK